MRALNFKKTKGLVALVLAQPAEIVRDVLHERLVTAESNKGQFYAGILQFADDLNLTADEWYDVARKLPIRVLRSGLDLRKRLSEEQLKRLPPETG